MTYALRERKEKANESEGVRGKKKKEVEEKKKRITERGKRGYVCM